MSQRLVGFPAVPQHTITVTLEATQFRVRYTYRLRMRSWYADIFAVDDTPLLLGRRLSPFWAIGLGLSVPGGPAGVLLVRGVDDYVRAALGDTLSLRYVTVAEAASAAPVTESNIVITTPP